MANPNWNASIKASTFVSRQSRRAKNFCWFLEIHVNWKSWDRYCMFVLLLFCLKVVQWGVKYVLSLLISGEMTTSFHGACYYFLLVFLNYLAWTIVHLKTITWLGFLSFHFVTSVLQGISLRKLISFVGCCSDTGSKFLC